MMLLPRPVATLVSVGDWSRLLFLARWHCDLHEAFRKKRYSEGPVPGFPEQLSSIWANIGNHEGDQFVSVADDVRALVDEQKMFSSQRCDEIGALLRHAAPHVLNGCSTEAAKGEVRNKFEDAALTLQCWSEAVGGARGMSRGRYRFNAELVLECIRLASYIKGGSGKVEAVVAKCIKISSSCGLTLPIASDDTVANKLPSRATLQYYELSLDMAIARQMQAYGDGNYPPLL